MLLTAWGIIASVVPIIVQKTSYSGLALPFMEKQSEYLFIGDRGATYGMDYSHEILANIKKKYIFWVISGAFESPIIKRVQLQITRSNQVKELFNIGMYLFTLKGYSNLVKHELILDFKGFRR